MYSRLELAFKYLRYYFTAASGKGHGIHSPFVFEFITKVLNDDHPYAVFDRIEKLRKKMFVDKTIIEVDDFGAGSTVSKSTQRTIASIAKNAVKAKKYSQVLFRMVNNYKPTNILELGTSLGITTAYLASANPEAKVITMEGAKPIAARADENFKTLGLNNIQIIEGNFDQQLSTVVHQLSSVDFAFIDGNHRQEPTERYLRQLMPKLHGDSIVVFDDIHWSHEMEAAWRNIKNLPAVQCSIDLFFLGIVFFRKEFGEKQHFNIRF
jgi:predicted O-methyltransferase YrrM